MLSKDEVHALIEKVCGLTRYHALVSVTDTEENTTRFANSAISQNVAVRDTVVTLTLYDKKKEASAVANTLTDEGLRQLARTAEALLPHMPDGAFDAALLTKTPVRELDSGGRLAGAFGAKERAAHIRAGVDALADGFTAAGALSLDRVAVAVGDSGGAVRYNAYDRMCFNTVVTHASGAAGGGACGCYDAAFGPGAVIPDLAIDAAFTQARETARKAIDPVRVGLGAYTVVLSPLALCDLLDYVAWAHNAKYADDGYSYTIGKLGERVFGANISVRDDVNHPGTQPLYFDMEGNARQAVDLIDKGVVKSLLHDNKTAARRRARSTGHAPDHRASGGEARNLVMQGGGQQLAAIIADTPSGIFINEFHYTNFVNPRALQVTGLTRNGAFLIQDGELTRPVATLRFTQGLIEAFNRVTALSSERGTIVTPYGSACVPAARIEGFCFTS